MFLGNAVCTVCVIYLEILLHFNKYIKQQDASSVPLKWLQHKEPVWSEEEASRSVHVINYRLRRSWYHRLSHRNCLAPHHFRITSDLMPLHTVSPPSAFLAFFHRGSRDPTPNLLLPRNPPHRYHLGSHKTEVNYVIGKVGKVES